MNRSKKIISTIISWVFFAHILIVSTISPFGFGHVEAAGEQNQTRYQDSYIRGQSDNTVMQTAAQPIGILEAASDEKLPIGDVDGSWTVNSIDFAYMRMKLLGIITEFPVINKVDRQGNPWGSDVVIWTSDLTGDNLFNSIDFAYMRMKLLGMIDKFPKDLQMTPTPTPTTTVIPSPTSKPSVVPSPSPTEVEQPLMPNEVSRNKIVMCSSYSGTGFEPDNVLDGKDNTVWSADNFKQWIRIDLGNEFTINKTMFETKGDKAYKYKIEASMDDENYSIIVDKTSNTLPISTYTDNFTEIKARFIKLTVIGIDGSTDNNVSIKELKVFRTSPDQFPSVLPSPTPIVVTDYHRPYVTLNLQTDRILLNESVEITVAAIDDIGVQTKTLKIDGVTIDLDEEGKAIYIPESAGVYKVEAFANDAAGNTGCAVKELRCITASDGTAPQAYITAPEYGAFAAMPIEIQGTAKDENICRFVLEYSEKDKNNYIRFAEGTTSIDSGVLGSFDPNTVSKGLYDIRLTVYDKGGLSAQAVTTLLADGKMTLRNFNVAYTDISIPVVNGQPFEMKRYYDSTNKTKGDFGYGWISEIDGIRLCESYKLSEGWTKILEAGVYFVKEQKPHYIVITYPDGRIDKFLVKLKNIYATDPLGYYSLGTEGMASFDVIFEPVTGTYSKLTAENTRVHIYTNIMNNKFGLWQYFIDEFSEEVYSQGKYTLTTQDGSVIKFDSSGKAESVTDAYGTKIVPQSYGLQYTRGTITKKLAYSKPQGVIESASDLKPVDVVYEYDQYGDLVSVTDLENKKTKFIYDNQHRLTHVISPDDVLITRNVYDDIGRLVYVYDAANRKTEFQQTVVDSKHVITVIDRRNNPTTYTFKPDGNLESVKDALENITSYIYKDNGLVDTVTGPKGSYTYDYEFNDDGTLYKITITDSEENYVECKYDPTGKLDTVSDISNPLLNVVDNDYDVSGKLMQTKDARGAVIGLGYDSYNRVKTVTDQFQRELMELHYDTATGIIDTLTDALENVTSYKEYDANGRSQKVETVRTVRDGVTEIITTQNIYDNLGRITDNTDAKGRTSKVTYNGMGKIEDYTDKYNNTINYHYDCLGNLSEIVYPDTTSVIYTYDEEGNMTSETDRESKTVYYTYDALNRLEKIVYPDGSFIKYKYNSAGEIEKITDPRGNSTEYQYDSLGRLQYIFNSARPDEKTEYIYTIKPFPDEMKDAKGNRFIFGYDANGRLEEIEYSDQTTYGIKYDDAGRISEVKDQNDKVTKYDYDYLGRLEKVTLAYGIEGKEEIWVYGYDEVGNLTSITDPRDKEAAMEYDNVGRLMKKKLPLNMFMEVLYDDDQKKVTVTDYNKESIVYKYDNNMRLDIKEVGDENTIDFDYTNEGLIETVVDKNGTTSYEYDDLYRLTKKTNPDNTTIEYFYDWAGNFTGVRTKGGATSYVYDVYNRLSKVIGSDKSTTTYLYDAVGNLEYILHQDGYKTQYIYDDQNRLTDVKRIKSDGLTVEYTYHYDLGYAGERKKVTETSGRTVEYDYDDCYRLKLEKITDPVLGNRVTTYQYDKAGNRLEKNDNGVITVYDPDDNNRIRSEGNITYTYDDNGNLKIKVEGSTTVTYDYDGENRLISVEKTESGTTSIENYEYDWEGNRIKKTTNGTVVKYLVDSNRYLAQVIEECDESGNLLAYYTYGNELISQKRSVVTNYYHYDGTGSIRRLTNEVGDVTDTYIYDAFGNILNRTGTTENSYMFAGEQFDANNGFYYLRARYMNPGNGNFITQDPYSGSIYDPISLHKYLYANASPVNFTDPTGYFSIPELLASFDIQATLNSIRCTALSALRNAAVGSITGALFGGIDAGLSGRNIVEGALNGSITGAAFGALATFSALRPVLGILGVKSGIEGVHAALEEENYALAGWRATMCITAIISLKKEIFNAKACFTEETLIYTKDGYKKIKDIQVGDEVYSENSETGEQGLKKVINVFVKEIRELIHLKVGEQEIKTTATHPFWVEEKGWVESGELKPGDRLVMYSGEILEVKEVFIEYLDRPIKVYNFEVEDWHTYFVSEYNVFVHNAGCGGTGGRKAKTGPKPAGTGPHNKKIADVANSVKDGEVIAGGQKLPEVSVKTPGGVKDSRRPDILVERPDGTKYGINVGKTTKSGAPIKREVDAIYDLEGAGLEMHYVPYD